MAKISDAQRKALATISTTRVYVLNDGSMAGKGITFATLTALRKAGMVTVNGASRAFIGGRAARRLVLTPAAVSALSE